MTSPCQKCGAKCCRYFCFQIDEPDDYEQFDDVRWYICHEGVSVHIDEDGDWYIQIMNPCNNLDDDSLCRIYEDRPLICRKYDTDGCEATDEDYGYQAEFTAPEQLEAYARKTLGEKKFVKQMVKHRAKLAGVTKTEMQARLFGADARPDSPKKKGKKGKKDKKRRKAKAGSGKK